MIRAKLFLVAAVAAAVAAAPASAVTTFATFSGLGDNVRLEKSGPNEATLFTISTTTPNSSAQAIVPDSVGVTFSFVNTPLSALGSLNAFTHGRPPVRLTVAAVDHRVRIDVEDCGPGIAPEDQPAMLQAFARGDTSRGHPGLGLGLAIVQRVASRLGGCVVFSRSAEDARAIVRVDWPMS